MELVSYRVRRGCKVCVVTERDRLLYRVDRVRGTEATITTLTEPTQSWTLDTSSLVVVREFGDPIYPGLLSTGRVERGGDKPPHLVINAENYHALETLLYTHEGAVDVIYVQRAQP